MFFEQPMDSLFHALVGAFIGECAPKSIKNRRLKGALASMSPDLLNIPCYLYLGFKSNSTLWYPKPEAFYENPWILDHWTWAGWNLTHSLLFWGIIVMPLIRRAKWTPLFGAAYLSHLLLDLPSHSGIWSVQPLWPFNWLLQGWFDAWAWNLQEILMYSTVPAFCWFMMHQLRSRDWILWPSEREIPILEEAH